MTLPAIDIPFKLPFDVPLLVHPIFVHFAVAIPIIVLLIELVNLKARNRAVSLTSLFLLTLAMIVYVGAFYTGKADGSEAFALLSEGAKSDLQFHKLLGTYLVYGTVVLFLLKLMAMAIKQNWARTLFLVILVLFLGLLLKQGKEGGDLVYQYGVNVKPVSELQDKIDDLQYDIDDLKAALQKAKAECAKKEQTEAVPAEPAAEQKGETSEGETPSESEPSAEPTSEATEKMKPLQEGVGEAEKNTSETIEHTIPENTTPVLIPTH